MRNPTLPVLMLEGAFCLSIVLTLLVAARHDARIGARIRAISDGVQTPPMLSSKAVFQILYRVGRVIVESGLLPAKTLAELEGTLIAAGYRAANALPLFVGAKAALTLCLPLVAWGTMRLLSLPGPSPAIVISVSGVIGLLLPDFIVRRLHRRYTAQIESGLGDALDLLIICAEAGLPLESGIRRVAVDLRVSNRPIAAEFEMIEQEMAILPNRRQALLNAATRTGLEEMARLGATLAQSMQYGTPLTQALRTLATESRADVLNRFEAKAARLPVLLTLPMVVFILPSLFIVIGTPAILQAVESFAGR
jgi:tight adherence protein C